MVDASVSPFVFVDGSGRVRWVGPGVEAMLGAPPSAYVGTHLLDVIAPTSHEAALAAFTGFVSEGHVQDWIGPPMVLDLRHADGSTVPCEISASRGRAFDDDGVFLQVRRTRATPLLYEAIDALAGGAPLPAVLERLADLCEYETPGSEVAIGFGWDGARFRSVVLGQAARARTGLLDLFDGDAPTPWHTAMHTDALTGPGDLSAVDPTLAERAAAIGYPTCWALPITRGPDPPEACLVLWRIRPGEALLHLITTAERAGRLVAVALEADENRGRLRRAARTDELTGLANRSAQRELLDDLTSRATADTPVSVLFCDLDDFKPINDEHGHDIGDRVLAIVAERLRGTIRNTEELARWGGDEFVVVSTIGDLDELGSLARRLIDTASSPMHIGDLAIHVGLSIGSATATEVVSADTLLRRADKALLAAKHEDHNTWHHAGDA